jgi:serine/threonine protein kinase
MQRRLDLMQREVRPRDSLSIRTDAERHLVKQVVARYRALPEEQRRERPALLNAVGKLEVAAGDFETAQRDFDTVASLVSDTQAKGEAHFNAYRAALEQRDWAFALRELTEAMKLDGKRFAPFPLADYEPEQILGAGGFGVTFLCRQRLSCGRVALKALVTDDLERDAATVMEEAAALDQLSHEGIIRLRHCGYADTARTRPYLVMEYFEGQTLEDYVRAQGRSLPLEAVLAVATQVAQALEAAHQAGILHRDVKPANILLRHAQAGRSASGQRWEVKLIDFGLALKQSALENAGTTQSGKTIQGSSIAGTLDYAAPEQLGKLPEQLRKPPEEVPIGPPADIYGFAKTCCYALFQTPQPLPRHWQSVPAALTELLGSCFENQPAQRPQDFKTVLKRLDTISIQSSCPHCSAPLKILVKFLGKTVKCPKCSSDFVATRRMATNAIVETSRNLTVYGQDLTFTATVKAASSATGAPTGKATFMDGETVLDLAPLSGETATLTTSSLSVGSHSIRVRYSGDDRFAASTSTPFPQTVTQALLKVTVKDASKVCGQANPDFTATYSGFVNGENEAALSGMLRFTTEATADSPAGSYPVTPSGLASSNYKIEFVSGTLTIDPKETIDLEQKPFIDDIFGGRIDLPFGGHVDTVPHSPKVNPGASSQEERGKENFKEGSQHLVEDALRRRDPKEGPDPPRPMTQDTGDSPGSATLTVTPTSTKFWCLNFDDQEVLEHALPNKVWMMQFQYAHDGRTYQAKKKARITVNWKAVAQIKVGDWCVAYLSSQAGGGQTSNFYAIGKVIAPRKSATYQDTVARTLADERHRHLDGVVYYTDASGAFYEDHTDTWRFTYQDRGRLKEYSYPQRVDIDEWRYAWRDENGYVPVNLPGLDKAAKRCRSFIKNAAVQINESFFRSIVDALREEPQSTG